MISPRYVCALTAMAVFAFGCSGSGKNGAGAGGNANGTGGRGSGGATANGGSVGIGGAVGPETCAEAAAAYTISNSALDASFVPHVVTRSWGSDWMAQAPVAVSATGEIYVGFSRETSAGLSAAIARVGGTAADLIEIPGAAMGGVAVTNDGLGALLFDPNDSVDDRTWAAVTRLDATGAERFTTDLFRSANLTDDGTRGAPGVSVFAYLPGSDELLAYFGHTRMTQAVRHEGGYLATVSASGTQNVLDDWFGSHNLDQRVSVGSSFTAVLGLGDAYPKGIFYSPLTDPRSDVVFTLAGNGVGTANGQLGGMVEFDDAIVLPFLTNDSISQDLTPGDWPNTDETISAQIEAAGNNLNVLALLTAPKARQQTELAPVRLDPALTAGAHLDSLKSARYGTGSLILLAWAEVSGSGRDETRAYFTMIVDRAGGVCQPKTPLDVANSFTGGDDMVLRADGSIVWANTNGGGITVVTLTPG
jgi:hypothetical protein